MLGIMYRCMYNVYTYLHVSIYILYIYIFNIFRYDASNMLGDLNREPSGKFQNIYRVSATDFEYLLNKVAPMIVK